MHGQAPAEGSLLGLAQPVLQLKREFSNSIERTLWRAAAFTGNGEHVCAASSVAHEHAIHIWARDWGSLEAVLTGVNYLAWPAVVTDAEVASMPPACSTPNSKAYADSCDLQASGQVWSRTALSQAKCVDVAAQGPRRALWIWHGIQTSPSWPPSPSLARSSCGRACTARTGLHLLLTLRNCMTIL